MAPTRDPDLTVAAQRGLWIVPEQIFREGGAGGRRLEEELAILDTRMLDDEATDRRAAGDRPDGRRGKRRPGKRLGDLALAGELPRDVDRLARPAIGDRVAQPLIVLALAILSRR